MCQDVKIWGKRIVLELGLPEKLVDYYFQFYEPFGFDYANKLKNDAIVASKEKVLINQQESTFVNLLKKK